MPAGGASARTVEEFELVGGSSGILISLVGGASLSGERSPPHGLKRVARVVPAYGLAAELLVSDPLCTFAP